MSGLSLSVLSLLRTTLGELQSWGHRSTLQGRPEVCGCGNVGLGLPLGRGSNRGSMVPSWHWKAAVLGQPEAKAGAVDEAWQEEGRQRGKRERTQNHETAVCENVMIKRYIGTVT